jgi:hydrophobic/amphiphilic exporter-1 (mainly G- bacteria), HAE1 family
MRYCERGMSRDDAIIQANRDRLRTILMTTIAFVAGMIPLVLTTGKGAATNRSIGTLVADGKTFCLLTLLAVPVFYSIWNDLGNHPPIHRAPARWRLFRQNLSPGPTRTFDHAGRNSQHKSHAWLRPRCP